MTKCFSKVTLADILFFKIRSVAFRVCMQQFPEDWYDLRYFTRISIMWLSNSQFRKIDSESFFVEPVFVLWEREK